MEHDFWHERWQNNQIAFHEDEGNALLRRHFGALRLAPGARVFVPLCGKTLDIGWLLDQGLSVAGVELSEIAIRQLFDELKRTPDVAPAGPLTRFSAPGLDIYVGDYFALTAEILGPVDAVYDRAALVALPAEMRKRYTAHLRSLTATVQQLLLTYEYDQTKMDGPPFSVSADEVRDHYAEAYVIEMLERFDIPGDFKRKVEASEAVWHLAPQ